MRRAFCCVALVVAVAGLAFSTASADTWARRAAVASPGDLVSCSGIGHTPGSRGHHSGGVWRRCTAVWPASIVNQIAVTTPLDLIPNPTLAAGTEKAPVRWSHEAWGSNRARFSYLHSGHGAGRSVAVTIGSYRTGDAVWYFAPVSAIGGMTYRFSDYYRSDARTELIAQVADTAGRVQWQRLAYLPAARSWRRVQTTFTTPSGTSALTVLHLLASKGSLQTSDFQLLEAGGSGSRTGSSPVQPGTTTPGAGTNGTTTPGNAGVPQGPTVPGPNLVANPGFEDSSGNNAPGWNFNFYNITATGSILSTGHSGSHSAQATVTAAPPSGVIGATDWSFTPVSVTGGFSYKFTDFYQSPVTTEVDVAYTIAGVTRYAFLATVPPTTGTMWGQATVQFRMPAGATSAVVYHLIDVVGTLTTDDYTFQAVPG
jgi:hypothetical protein